MLKLKTLRRNGLATLGLMTLALLTACGGEGEATTATGTVPVDQATTATTSTLAISGAPATTATSGRAYSFTPVVAQASGAVAFSVTNKPAWAVFSTATGTLSGTPADANIANYPGIVITATDVVGSAALAAFAINVVQAGASTGSATLSWLPPTQNTDGTAASTLAGYYVYYGNDPGALTTKIQINNPGLTTYTVADLAPGTYYFGLTAYTTAGVESGLSEIGSKTIP